MKTKNATRNSYRKTLGDVLCASAFSLFMLALLMVAMNAETVSQFLRGGIR